MRKVKVRFKDGVKAIVFDPKHPPSCACSHEGRMDDSSGIFVDVKWLVGGNEVHKGDLILSCNYGLNLSTSIVVPQDAVGKLVEVVE